LAGRAGDGVRRASRWLFRRDDGGADRSSLGTPRCRGDRARNLRGHALETATLMHPVTTPITKKTRLPREFYTRGDVLTVARDLLGKLLVVPDERGRRVSGMIVEVEAYRGPEDRASHAYGGRRTRRTETMYGQGGVAYVYFVYGMYFQFNVV